MYVAVQSVSGIIFKFEFSLFVCRNHLISMIHNAWFKVMANITTTESVIKAFISPLPSNPVPVKIDVTTILSGLLFPFATSLLFPVCVWVHSC